jgi:hypothetical protein
MIMDGDINCDIDMAIGANIALSIVLQTRSDFNHVIDSIATSLEKSGLWGHNFIDAIYGEGDNIYGATIRAAIVTLYSNKEIS